MKSIRFRTRLLLSFWFILLLALCLPAYYIFQTLEKDIYKEAKANALTQLNFVHWLLEEKPAFEDNLTFDRWCKKLGKQLKYRITVIAAGGRVIADSDVPENRIPLLDNHADREEIIGARKLGQASSIRYSITLKRKLIYAAKNINLPNAPSGVLRVAIPLSTVETRLSSFAHRFWGILFVIFIITTLLSFILARKLESPIIQIIQAATAIGDGNYEKQLDIETNTEFSRLSICINDMADKIQLNVAMITGQKQELEAVLEGMQEGVMLLDENGKIKATNQALTWIAKCVPSCIGHRPMEVFLNPEIQDACNEILNEKEHLRLKVPMPNDTVYEVNLVKIPDGGAVVVFHDISELVRLEKVRQDFVANVSHELRTPLTSIKGYAETLLDEKFRATDQADSFVNTIVKNANQMSNVVSDLLELTKLQQKQQKPDQLFPVNATTCFNSAMETCMPMIKEKNIRITNHLNDSIIVVAEENALIQIFRNLLDNAIRHSPPETKILVFAQKKDNNIVLGIQDEGTGIPLRHQKRIFERFYRVDKERSRASGGTGLGLSICRNAVQKMGGNIWVKSPPDDQSKGSVFYFSLRVRK
ncbi:MAG: cell wall metabolism sensor histidine kinase WalK [Desulfobacteraceae bacterium]|nr:GHKL domain-containing protein [Desulfobacteraceae bacterium]MBC2754386.1 cell wall metabolism sensor histidine kinase WalK [Desulfobacteraceae bacterium]